MTQPTFVICTDNSGYEASLETRKLYEALPDSNAATHGQIRVIDESGEDYLCPWSMFTGITLPQEVIDRVFHLH